MSSAGGLPVQEGLDGGIHTEKEMAFRIVWRELGAELSGLLGYLAQSRGKHQPCSSFTCRATSFGCDHEPIH